MATDFRYGIPGEFPIVRCHRCGLVRTDPRPTIADLPRYYPASYSAHRGEAVQYESRGGALLRRLALGPPTRLRSWAMGAYNTVAYRALLARRPGRLLDVGCGLGHYLEIWRSFGWEVEGLEPSADAAAAARQRLGVRIEVGSAEDADLPAARFDVVTLCHSLEHFRSPRAALQNIRRSLVPNGKILLMVPNFAAWDRRWFAPEWYAMEVPRHLFHFEPASLRALLHAAGFRVERLGGSAHPDVLVRSLRRRRGAGDPERPVGRGARGAGTLLLLLPALLRRSSSLWAIARPSSEEPAAAPGPAARGGAPGSGPVEDARGNDER